MHAIRSIATGITIVTPVFFVICVIWLMISCFFYFASIRAEGNVVQLIERKVKDGDIYSAVFVFTDSSGITHTIKSKSGSNPPRFPVGTKVSVLYRTQDPENAFIEDRLIMWIVPLILIGLSLLYGAAAFFLVRWLQKKDARNSAAQTVKG